MEIRSNSFNQDTSSIQINLKRQDFLDLIMTHMQKEILVHPQKSSEFSSIFQLDTYDTIVKRQESAQQMTNFLQSNHALQASALVGRQVLIESNTFKLKTEGGVKIGVEVFSGMNRLSASIFTESDNLIKILSLGNPEPGLMQFYWDGVGTTKQLPEGKYKIEVHAFYKNKKKYLKTMIFANVDSVTFNQNGEGLKLNVAGVGSLLIDKIKQILV